jgi:hypothetical protein
MDKIKVYLRNFNGIMDGILKCDEFDRVLDPRDCDAIVVWQDVRGEYAEIAKINKKHLKKPLIVVQHGAGATRDYEHPENFPLLADKFCCWGSHDYDRLIKQGRASQAVLTGCPLTNQLKPKEKHDDKNIVFCPIITTHEEPANLITFYELKKIELDYSQKVMFDNKERLIKEWRAEILNPNDRLSEADIPYYDINKNFRVISKLTPIHDKGLYLGSVVETNVGSPTHIEDCVKLLTNTDVVVGMVESTFQLLAMAMDIPVVICKEWEFKLYAGKDYTHCDHLKTDAATYADVKELRQVIEQELSNPERLKEERKKVVLRELGDITQDPDKKIIEVIKGELNG